MIKLIRKFRQNYTMTSSVVYEGNLRTVATHLRSGTQIETDAPVDNQGKGERFSPSDLVATALGSCMMTIMGMKARDLDLDLTNVKIEVEKIMKADPRRIGGINLTFHFPEGFSADEKQRVILERAAHTCPVVYSINPEIIVNVQFNWPVEVGSGAVGSK
jgi:putative redox protein